MTVDRRRFVLGLGALPLAGAAQAQGFAGLGTDAEGFALPARDHRFVFPRDHAAHPDFRIEWWYVTGNLTDAQGVGYGIQWTLFRSALAPETTAQPGDGWTSPQIWLAHAALTRGDHHHVAERLARGGIGAAGVRSAPFAAWIDDWAMLSQAGPEQDALDLLHLTARGSDFSYDLGLRAEGPLIFHGDAGYSVKSPAGQASHYYSQPFYQVTGEIRFDGQVVEVIGHAWLDREWSSQPLAGDQSGWDWFSLSFDSGDKLMAFQLRDDGDGFRSGSWIAPDGHTTPIGDRDIRMTPLDHSRVDGRRVPTRWQIDLPARELSVTVTALNPQSWMATSVPYWEGPVRLKGSHAGQGYLEMTGY
ncbi:MAG: iron ABC transporter permease [Marinibacterium sp.]|nr:iron ABC transporter permease [Marinibacterium sp.]